jgi:hypothetical protein
MLYVWIFLTYYVFNNLVTGLIGDAYIDATYQKGMFDWLINGPGQQGDSTKD